MKDGIYAKALPVRDALNKLYKAFDGDSNDAEYDAARDLAEKVEALLQELAQS